MSVLAQCKGPAMASPPTEGVNERIISKGSWADPQEVISLNQHLKQAAALANWLAHDFGNTLTGVLGVAELLRGQLPAGSVEQDYVSQIQQSAQQGAELIRRLLLFSRLSPGRS